MYRQWVMFSSRKETHFASQYQAMSLTYFYAQGVSVNIRPQTPNKMPRKIQMIVYINFQLNDCSQRYLLQPPHIRVHSNDHIIDNHKLLLLANIPAIQSIMTVACYHSTNNA